MVAEVQQAVGKRIVVGKGHDLAADLLHHLLIPLGVLFGVQPWFDL